MEQGQVPLQEKNSQETAVQQLLHLDTAPADENDLIIFIEGVYQNQDAYSVSGTTLTMADAPVSGRGLVVYQVSAAVAGAGMAVNTMTGDNSDTTLTLAVAPRTRK